MIQEVEGDRAQKRKRRRNMSKESSTKKSAQFIDLKGGFFPCFYGAEGKLIST